MTWFLGFLAAAIATAWWLSHRKFVRHWRQLEQWLDDLAAGRTPGSAAFPDSGRFAALTHPLEKLAAEQERLRGQSAREEFNLRTILASMAEGVMVVDAQHVLRLVNPSFIRLFEPKGDPLGQTVLQFLREPELEEMISAALATGEPQTREVGMNGGRPARHFAVHSVPMRDQAGTPGVVTIFRDITRLKQLEDVRREFVANVSHELRTPLSIFHGFLENLRDAPAMSRPDQAEIFAIMDKHSQRLNALLEDLLTLARLESRQETLRPEEIVVAELLRGVSADWESKIAKKNLTLTLDVAADLPPLFADPLRLEQVLNNLLENAVKYTEPGGKSVSARRVPGSRSSCAWRTAASVFRPPICRTSSSASTAPTKPAPASRAAPGSGSRSSNTSRKRTAARSLRRASMAWGRRSSCGCQWVGE